MAGCIWIFAVIISGITGSIVYSLDLGTFSFGGWILLGVFSLMSLALVVSAIYKTLQAGNPRPTLVCSHRDWYPGTEVEISWLFSSNVNRISQLRISIEGAETVSYRQGTTTRTEKATFFNHTLVDTDDISSMTTGYALVALPADTMHTFIADRNKVEWALRVKGTIKNWPDIDDEFPVVVLPPQV